MESPPPEQKPRSRLTPFSIGVTYIVAGGAWFLITDEVINRFLSIPIPVHLLFARAAVFILVTAVLLYYLVRRLATDLSRSNAELQESTARANAYLESAVEGIVSVDDEGVTVSANPAIEKLFGYTRHELIGRSIEILIPERVRTLHMQHRARYFESPRSRPMGLGLDLVGRRKDESEFPIEVSLSFVQTEKNRLVIAFVSDITERRVLEREVRRNQTLATLGVVAAGIVHEINTPIGIISSRAEFLLAEADSRNVAADLRDDLEVLHRNAVRVGRISQGLLTLASHEHNAWSSVSINDVIENALLLVSKQMSKEGVRIESVLDPALPQVFGDPTAIEEVLINLFVNAREAMPGGGTIRIETRTATDPSGRVRIIVADQGPGIPVAEAARLFDPFFSTKETGMGIGLWLSKRIIREHQGAIEVESEPGKGTRFLISLPATSGPAR
jgi:PAS domain S-box-containing protein